MNTIYLEPAQVPAHLRAGYAGKMFKAHVCETVTIYSDAGLWDGGSRETYRTVRLADGAEMPASDNISAPWDGRRRDRTIPLQPGLAVVRHDISRGRDLGLTFFVHPADAVAMLPAPCTLTEHQLIVLRATRTYKPSYGGQDRYTMAREATRYGAGFATFPTRPQWEVAKAELITAGLLNKAGAITTTGRNAA